MRAFDWHVNVKSLTNAELADWLLEKRFVSGMTGHDWADREKLAEIAKRLRDATAKPADGAT